MGEITEILRKYGVKLEKGLSQNFLVDKNIVDKITNNSGFDENTAVIEIGGGAGSLTVGLLRASGKVVVIELDRKMVEILTAEYGENPKLTVINADIMKLDLNEIVKALAQEGFRVSVCANLPYHITTPVIMKLLEETSGIKTLTLMMQKEVADRILARPATKEYGSITPVINYYADVRLLASVPPGCFIPPPKVQSSVLRFEIRDEKLVSPKNERLMLDIIRAAFSQRRKTLLNTLTNKVLPGISMSREQLLECFSDERLVNIGVSPQVRGETLSIHDFSTLSDIIAEYLLRNVTNF